MVPKDGKEKGLLNYFFPMPKALEGTTSPASKNTKKEKNTAMALHTRYGFDCWYDWRVKNWSTKWEITDTYGKPEVSNNGKTISFGFDSAWAPPVGEHMKNG